MVEFALIIPIFLLFVFGILDLGRAVYAYNTLNNAAREGARVAIVDQTLTRIQDRASSRAVGLGVAPAQVTVDYRTSPGPGYRRTRARIRSGSFAERPRQLHRHRASRAPVYRGHADHQQHHRNHKHGGRVLHGHPVRLPNPAIPCPDTD